MGYTDSRRRLLEQSEKRQAERERWARWYEKFAELGGSRIVGSFGEAREFFDLGITPQEAIQALDAGFTVAELEAELEAARDYLEAEAELEGLRADERPDLRETDRDERARDLERLEAESEAAIAALETAIEGLEDPTRPEADREAGIRKAEAEFEATLDLAAGGYSLAEDLARQREAEALEAETELIVRAAEANRPELAPDPTARRRPSLSARGYVGSSWNG